MISAIIQIAALGVSLEGCRRPQLVEPLLDMSPRPFHQLTP
jgi:hypothetical protein